MKANYANALCHCNATPLNKSKMEQCLGGGLLSLSLSLSRCSHLWHAFALILQGFSHTQFLKQKFKFFTQNSSHFTDLIHFINSKHFINSTHFIKLSQNLSHTQGFFIPLPQIFAQFLLINSIQKEKQWLSQTNSKGI